VAISGRLGLTFHEQEKGRRVPLFQLRFEIIALGKLMVLVLHKPCSVYGIATAVPILASKLA
jgi:hypothetical protein